MASQQQQQQEQQYAEQLQLLRTHYPLIPTKKLQRFLQQHSGDVEQVHERLIRKESRAKSLKSLETRFGTVLTALQQENPTFQCVKRFRLLKIMEHFDGNVDHVRNHIQKVQAKNNSNGNDSKVFRRQQREELQTKYAAQLTELRTIGIDVHHPRILQQLEKYHGDINKIMEMMKYRREKKDQMIELNTKYNNEIAQLEADGVKIKKRCLLIKLLEKADGQVDVVKQLLAERKERKHGNKPSTDKVTKDDRKVSSAKQRREINPDDVDNLKRLRSADIHGNPVKILSIFHQCNESIEMTKARMEKEREEREKQSRERAQQRTLLVGIRDAYLTLNSRDDWPDDIEQVYLDGNNMMFVVDSLRRLCLNRASRKTERAIAELAAAWNEQMHIPNVELIFDSTRQLDQVGSVKVSSAHPTYKTTDDMLIEIARRAENQEKNKRTIVVTSDRLLACHLKHEGCQLVKSYSWFSHCVMVLTPDLITNEQSIDTNVTSKSKRRYNLDELVHRIVKIDL